MMCFFKHVFGLLLFIFQETWCVLYFFACFRLIAFYSSRNMMYYFFSKACFCVIAFYSSRNMMGFIFKKQHVFVLLFFIFQETWFIWWCFLQKHRCQCWDVFFHHRLPAILSIRPLKKTSLELIKPLKLFRLVVWNIFIFPYNYWEFHPPNWRTHIFQRGFGSPHQPDNSSSSIIINHH